MTSVAISRDNACHLVSVADGSVKLIDRETGQLLAAYRGFTTPQFHDYKVEAVFDCGDEAVVVGSPLGKVILFDLVSEKATAEILTSAPVVSLSSHTTKERLAVAAAGTLLIYDRSSSSELDSSP